ncbi:MAG: hypothetical protein V1792_10210 [Pseudomonadota bacterium]
MEKFPDWSSAAPRIRTLFFLAAMIPVAAVVFILSLVSLVAGSPWIVRLIICGSRINSRPKLPWHRKRPV